MEPLACSGEEDSEGEANWGELRVVSTGKCMPLTAQQIVVTREFARALPGDLSSRQLVAIENPTISRTGHCLLERASTHGRVFVRDLGSRNGSRAQLGLAQPSEALEAHVRYCMAFTSNGQHALSLVFGNVACELRLCEQGAGVRSRALTPPLILRAHSTSGESTQSNSPAPARNARESAAGVPAAGASAQAATLLFDTVADAAPGGRATPVHERTPESAETLSYADEIEFAPAPAPAAEIIAATLLHDDENADGRGTAGAPAPAPAATLLYADDDAEPCAPEPAATLLYADDDAEPCARARAPTATLLLADDNAGDCAKPLAPEPAATLLYAEDDAKSCAPAPAATLLYADDDAEPCAPAPVATLLITDDDTDNLAKSCAPAPAATLLYDDGDSPAPAVVRAMLQTAHQAPPILADRPSTAAAAAAPAASCYDAQTQMYDDAAAEAVAASAATAAPREMSPESSDLGGALLAPAEQQQQQQQQKQQQQMQQQQQQQQQLGLDDPAELSVPQLKDALRALGLPVTGRKADLAARLRAQRQAQQQPRAQPPRLQPRQASPPAPPPGDHAARAQQPTATGRRRQRVLRESSSEYSQCASTSSRGGSPNGVRQSSATGATASARAAGAADSAGAVDAMTLVQLRAQLQAAGLAADGRKAELQARLRANIATGAAVESAPSRARAESACNGDGAECEVAAPAASEMSLATAAATATAAAIGESDVDAMTLVQLRAQLQAAGLAADGRKAELQARLRAHWHSKALPAIVIGGKRNRGDRSADGDASGEADAKRRRDGAEATRSSRQLATDSGDGSDGGGWSGGGDGKPALKRKRHAKECTHSSKLQSADDGNGGGCDDDDGGGRALKRKRSADRGDAAHSTNRPFAGAPNGNDGGGGDDEPAPKRKRGANPPLNVLLTGLVRSDLSTILAQIGARVTDDPTQARVLVAPGVRRTLKFLCALCCGADIVSERWLDDSAAAGRPLSAADYAIRDVEAEREYEFSLADAQARARSGPPVLLGRRFALALADADARDSLGRMIKVAGGTLCSLAAARASGADVLSSSEPADVAVRTAARLDGRVRVLAIHYVSNALLRQRVVDDPKLVLHAPT